MSQRDAEGLPTPRLECRDDDPTCDFGPTAGDAACTFRLAVCLNVQELRKLDARTGLPACTSAGVTKIRIDAPSEIKRRSSIEALNRRTLEGALAGLNGGTVNGRCRSGRVGNACATDAQCDNGAGVLDGKCRGRLIRFAPDLTVPDVCTEVVEIVVPLRSSGKRPRPGGTRIRLTSTAADQAVNGKSARDAIELICQPTR